MTHITAHFATPALTDVSTEAKIQVGTKVPLSDGGEAVYVQATSIIAQYNAVAVAVDYTVTNLTTTQITEGSGVGRQIGFCQVSIPASSYGWVHLSGRPKVKLAANCADRVALYTTATEGVLDDAVVSIGEVAGVVSKTTISNATAVTVMVPSAAQVTNFAVQA